MSRWSTRRGQTEPTAALVSVFAVCVGLALYAGALEGTLAGDDRSRAVAEPTLERVHETLAPAGVADPDALSDTLDAGPDGYHLAVSVAADGERWRAGPAAPETAATAARPVSVSVAPGVVVAGTLRVEVWT
ncbi:DUF7285 family protein [Haloarchaeobius sp. HRN-SO-5]|uniref:DUF7285 family protein n=1 Tax=Haloarchaeobius sp. HRN-SO-5 TaxID=3446118 RepID=UPI003EBE37C6